jgi:protein-glutamine gamma-glutamyltransferase
MSAALAKRAGTRGATHAGTRAEETTDAADIPVSAQRWALAGLLGAVLLNAHHTAIWCLPVALGAAALRIWAAQRPARLMGRAPRIIITVILTLGVLASFRTLNGLDAGASLLVAMAALKLMETGRLRDWLIVLGAALFLLLAACLADQALWLAPLYAAELWLLCAALYALGAGASVIAPAALLRVSGKSLLLALPLAVVLFLFFPRLSGGLWTVPREDEAVTGLGEQMSPGSISQLAESDEPALRARFEGPPPPLQERYWRGPVLHQFDGYTWTHARLQLGAAPATEYAGRSYRYEITLEPNTHGVLIALEMPRGVPPELPQTVATFDQQLLSSKPPSSAISYHLESFPQHRSSEPLSADVRALDLALPRGRNPRSLELAQSLRAGSRDERGYIEAVLSYLQHGGFSYTLTPQRLSRNSIDDLLFNTHEGFCGHYASAFTTLMRAGGIPAHIVTGYLGGDWNRFGNYLLIRQANAHAWTEVWLDGPGWIRIDPTAVVAPDRINKDLDSVLEAAGMLRHGGSLRPWIAATAQAWAAINAWWQDEFVNFNMSRQLGLLARLGLKDRDLDALVAALAVGGTLWLSLLAWRSRGKSAEPRDDLSRVWRALERTLGSRGSARAPHEGAVAYSERIARARPELAHTLKPLARQYARLRYGRQYSAAELARFRRAVRLFRNRTAR